MPSCLGISSCSAPILHMPSLARCALPFLAVFALLAGCDSGEPEAVEPETVNPALTQVWSLPQEPHGGPQTTPLNVGDSLVVAAAGLDLICVRTQTGEEKWRTRTDPNYTLLSYSLLTDGERVYTSQSTRLSPEFRAYDLETGALLWTKKAGGSEEITAISPYALYAAGDGAFFGTTHHGQVFAVDGASGAMRWLVQLDSAAADALTYEDGVLYAARGRVAGGAVGALTAYDAQTGEEMWSHFHSQPIWIARPIVRGNSVFGFSNILIRLDKSTGAVLSTSSINPSTVSMDPFLDGDIVYGADNSPWKLDLQTGEVLWRNYSYVGAGGYNTVALGNTVYWARGEIEVLSPSTGQRRESVSAPGGYVLRVSTSGGLVLAQTGGALTAYLPGQ